jgi:hypothetical protein
MHVTVARGGGCRRREHDGTRQWIVGGGCLVGKGGGDGAGVGGAGVVLYGQAAGKRRRQAVRFGG